MEPALTVAIITAFATIVATLIPIVIENLHFMPINNSRQKQLNGSWRGSTIQFNGPDGNEINVELVCEIKKSWRKVNVETRVKGGGTELRVSAHGGFIWGDYLRLDYKSIDQSIINFGCVVLRLHANGKILSGKMIGFGSQSEKLIDGVVNLEKIQD